MSEEYTEHWEHQETFNKMMGRLDYAISKEETPQVIIRLAEKIFDEDPDQGEEILDKIKSYLNCPSSQADIIFLWNSVVFFRKDLVDTFLKFAVTSTEQKNFLFPMLNDITIRQNISVVSQIIAHGASIDEEMTNKILKNMLRTALRDTMQFDNGAFLLEFLAKQPAVIGGHYDSGVGEGNALYLWAMNLPEQQFEEPAAVKKALKTLLQAGVRGDEEILVKTARKEPYVFQSLMEMACWNVDNLQNSGLIVIDHLINEGIAWGQLDQGESASAKYIQRHPLVQTWYRRQDLEAFIPETKTRDGRLKM